MADVDKQIEAVQQQLETLRKAYNAYSAEFNTEFSYFGNYTHPRAIELDNLRKQTLKQIAAAEDQLQKLQEQQAKINDGMAEAARKGLTGDAAVAYAEGKLQTEKQRNTIILIAVAVVAVAVIAWVWAKYLKR